MSSSIGERRTDRKSSPLYDYSGRHPLFRQEEKELMKRRLRASGFEKEFSRRGSSVHNYLGQAGVAAYAATKGGVVSMARSFAADLAPGNIRVNVVAPGATWKRGPGASIPADESAKVAKFVSSTIPLGRLGRAGRRCQSRALPSLGRFLVRQCSRAGGGWRNDGCPVWSFHSSWLIELDRTAAARN